MEMDGKVALITGANRGLGFALAKALGERGVTVLMVSRDGPAGRGATEELQVEGLEAVPYVADVGDPDSIQALHREVSRDYRRLDALVNNAGINPDEEETTVETLEWEVFDRAMRVNFRGPVWMCKMFVPMLRNSESGRVINYTSGLGRLTVPRMGPYPAYSMSKGALNCLTKVLAAEVEEDGIIVNSVDPGWCRTGMGGPQAPRTAEEGITAALHLATADAEELETGCLYHDREVISW